MGQEKDRIQFNLDFTNGNLGIGLNDSFVGNIVENCPFLKFCDNSVFQNQNEEEDENYLKRRDLNEVKYLGNESNEITEEKYEAFLDSFMFFPVVSVLQGASVRLVCCKEVLKM